MDSNADRFLNCVMKRSEHDALFRIVAVLLIMVLIPVLSMETTLGIIEDYEEIEDMKDQLILGTIAIAWTIVLFIQYLEVKSLSSHRIRDMEWMESLMEYSRSRGNDVSRMEALLESDRMGLPKKALLATKATFAVMATLNFDIILLFNNGWIEGGYDVQISIATSMLIFLEMTLVSLHIDRTTVEHDEIQHEFTAMFVESMGGDLADIGPMTTPVTERRLKIWFHLLLTAATAGVYSVAFNLLTLHRTNLHVSTQWAYEERLVAAIGRLEGATRVERVESEGDRSLVSRIVSIVKRDRRRDASGYDDTGLTTAIAG